MTSIVLFLCTGNFYRSRFAELLFNARAAQEKLDWRAESRGIAVERGWRNVGPVAPVVLDELARRGLPVPAEPRYPLQLLAADLEAADRIIALDAAEHRPLMAKKFPAWAQHVAYWKIPDAHLLDIELAFRRIAKAVEAELERCRG